jgi:hypothetical protein
MFSLVQSFRVNGLKVEIMMDLDNEDSFPGQLGSYCYFIDLPEALSECCFGFDSLTECMAEAVRVAESF